MSLKFKLEPTMEFNEAVNDIIDSKDPRKFKDIINEFGQFIPKEIILDGRELMLLQKKVLKKMLANILQIFKLFGGKQFGPNNFNEEDWIESLNDFKYWNCIKFKGLINIFQALSEELRKKVLLLVGKKILFTSIEDNPRLIIHCIQKKFRGRECKLKIRRVMTNFDFNRSDLNVKLKILKNEFNATNDKTIVKPLDLEYDSSILCFGIPVLRKLDDSSNSLVIGHHFFNDKENRKIGTYLFSYCLEKNHYVNLPNFTFYTLVISCYPNSGNYGISTFRHTNKIGKFLNLIKFNSFKSSPKFISLYSTGENECSPIFFKQKDSKINIKYINVDYNQDDCICKNKRFMKLAENNLKYAFLDPRNPN
ncbi:hypothetical protein GLOIN_2v1786313 [Rhizophagus clarus]|nr:hypothetical protein GLOIN_2v1786313 [Rhizophagus clarus]